MISSTDTLLNPLRMDYQLQNIFEKNPSLSIEDKAVTHDRAPAFYMGEYAVNVDDKVDQMIEREVKVFNFLNGVF